MDGRNAKIIDEEMSSQGKEASDDDHDDANNGLFEAISGYCIDFSSPK
jgi:hypothetical protein